VLLVVVLLLAALGSCVGDDGPSGKYTPEECAGLLLVANNNGNSTWERADAAAEYDVNCQ
jgi:hypothetical protein